jgi:dihydrofolate synthase/folylpolyglutamate synthase
MDYQQTLEYLYSQLPMYQRVGKAAYKASLDNTLALCKMLGNPERKFKSIHIAGTNGKGSTAHLLASMLQEYGLKTGLYTSPHLVDFRERIRINGQKVPEIYVIDFVKGHKQGFEKIKPSFFEMTAAMAFDHFAGEKADIAIIETGMGGRLDSTNVIIPEISVITNIGYDHMQFLGNTLEKIAREKAAIIKKGKPVVIGEKQENIQHVFIETAGKFGSDIVFAVDDVLFAKDLIKQARVPLKGDFLERNMITAIAVIGVFNTLGHNVQEEHIRKGIENVVTNTGLMGRWQIIAEEPLTICDVGHNYDGLKLTMRQLAGQAFEKLHFVLGSVNDKDLTGILGLLPQHADYYFCRPGIPRGLSEHELYKLAMEAGLRGRHYPSVMDAYNSALSRATKKDLLFIGGSTFVVAEVLAGLELNHR